MELRQHREAARDLFVRLRLGRVAELHALGHQVFHDDDALPSLGIEISEVAGRVRR